jgi:hypothetical protein
MEYLHSNTLPKKHLRAAFFLREYFFPFGCPICGTCLVDTKETCMGFVHIARASLKMSLKNIQGNIAVIVANRLFLSTTIAFLVEKWNILL